MNGPYVRQMIPKPGDPDREVPVNETFHEQTDEELTEKELEQENLVTCLNKWIESSDNGIQRKSLSCLMNGKGIRFIQNAVQNPGVHIVGNQNGLIVVLGLAKPNANQIGNELCNISARIKDLDEIEEVNANCILMANLQQASTSGTQTNNATIYDR
ncbi:hypothetical protein Tco_1070032 [Tanacetum coccineum]|uniref:Uncharacterized protein n=1 Tax=Tanacetum coccineum TaxID=301880 RepID=A0ABQ5HKK8_9ASTR